MTPRYKHEETPCIRSTLDSNVDLGCFVGESSLVAIVLPNDDTFFLKGNEFGVVLAAEEFTGLDRVTQNDKPLELCRIRTSSQVEKWQFGLEKHPHFIPYVQFSRADSTGTLRYT